MTLNRSRRVIRLAALGAVLGAASIGSRVAQNPEAGAMITLGNSVIIAPDGAAAYVADPEGGTRALDIATGKTTWYRREADRPLAVAGDRVVGLAPEARPNELTVVALNRESGEVVSNPTAKLPEEVQATPSAAPGAPLEVDAAPADGNEFIISLRRNDVLIRGIPDEADQPLPTPPGAEPEGVAPANAADAREGGSFQGAFRLDAAGNLTPVPEEVEPAGAAPADAQPEAAQPLETADPESPDEVKVPSVDGRHYLIVEEGEFDPQNPAVTLHFHNAENQERIGSVSARTAPEAFVVLKDRALLLTASYPTFTAGKSDTEPMRVWAYDLADREAAWSAPVRDDETPPVTPP